MIEATERAHVHQCECGFRLGFVDARCDRLQRELMKPVEPMKDPTCYVCFDEDCKAFLRAYLSGDMCGHAVAMYDNREKPAEPVAGAGQPDVAGDEKGESEMIDPVKWLRERAARIRAAGREDLSIEDGCREDANVLEEAAAAWEAEHPADPENGSSTSRSVTAIVDQTGSGITPSLSNLDRAWRR